MIKFLRIPKNRKYDYKPVYFDPDEDELTERVRLIQAEIDAEEGLLDELSQKRYDSERSERMALKFERARENNMRSYNGGYSVTKIFLILSGLTAFIYYFFIH